MEGVVVRGGPFRVGVAVSTPAEASWADRIFSLTERFAPRMRVLIVLSQRPELTGSGITLDALVRHAAAAGHDPWVLCGVPVGEPVPSVGGLPSARVRTVRFGEGGDLPFAIPGMSDVMPYRSRVWSEMTEEELRAYRNVWREHLVAALEQVDPDIVHTNHLWLVSALLPELLGGRPSVAHCHATGLRQMELCPTLRGEVVEGLRGHRAFAVLHEDHAKRVAEVLRVPASRVHVVGAGYREDLFHQRGAASPDQRQRNLLYVGKFSAAKGLPWLLDACEVVWRESPDLVLHVVGDGSGEEAEVLRGRMGSMAPRVVLHGRLDQPALASLMRRCASLVLPSFYEGLPLVLAEARACGCNLVSTALTGVVQHFQPCFGEALRLVEMPALIGPDRPDPRDLGAFTRNLASAITDSLSGTAAPATAAGMAALNWGAVFERVQAVWETVTTAD